MWAASVSSQGQTAATAFNYIFKVGIHGWYVWSDQRNGCCEDTGTVFLISSLVLTWTKISSTKLHFLSFWQVRFCLSWKPEIYSMTSGSQRRVEYIRSCDPDNPVTIDWSPNQRLAAAASATIFFYAQLTTWHTVHATQQLHGSALLRGTGFFVFSLQHGLCWWLLCWSWRL